MLEWEGKLLSEKGSLKRGNKEMRTCGSGGSGWAAAEGAGSEEGLASVVGGRGGGAELIDQLAGHSRERHTHPIRAPPFITVLFVTPVRGAGECGAGKGRPRERGQSRKEW